MMVSMLPASAVTAFADNGADSSVSAADNAAYQKLVDAINAAKAGDTVKLTEDVDVQQTIVVDKQLTLDLAGHKLYNKKNDLWYTPTTNEWSLVSVRGNGDLTITGNGTLAAKENDCYAVDVQDTGAKLTVENGTFIGNISAVYVFDGTATVKGGTFSIQQLDTENPGKPYEFMLNCYDANRAAGTAKIAVTGGTFSHFNPANNGAEGAGTNFCPNGYTTTQDGDWYTVNPRTYENVNTDVKPDANPEEKTDTTEVGKPVDLDVTVTGDKADVDNIAKLSLNFSNPEAVETVKLKYEGRTYDLTGFASQNYQDIEISKLTPEEEETEIALLSAEPITEKMILSVTYNTSGEHSVGVVFKDIGDAVVSSSQKEVKVDVAAKSKLTFTDCTATVDGKEIASGDEVAEGKTVTLKLATNVDQMKFGGFVLDPQQELTKVDDTTATFVMPDVPVTVTVQLVTEDSDDGVDAMTVVAGVAVGAGAAVLTYHIGTEIYAKNVLGEGVAVPKTREEVALKAWELAGKPAVAMDGEPLSEAAQAEKWVVESGLMQNDAEGNFNGSKKMNKLMALRTLDAAKKLG